MPAQKMATRGVVSTIATGKGTRASVGEEAEAYKDLVLNRLNVGHWLIMPHVLSNMGIKAYCWRDTQSHANRAGLSF